MHPTGSFQEPFFNTILFNHFCIFNIHLYTAPAPRPPCNDCTAAKAKSISCSQTSQNSGHRAKIKETHRPARPNKNNTGNNLAIACGVHLVSSQRRFARSCDPFSPAVAVIASLNKYELLRWGFYLHAHLCLSLRLCLLCWSPPSCPATFRLDLKSSKHLRKKCCISHLICLCLTFCLAKVKKSKKL